jgi:hypothetical protein
VVGDDWCGASAARGDASTLPAFSDLRREFQAFLHLSIRQVAEPLRREDVGFEVANRRH